MAIPTNNKGENKAVLVPMDDDTLTTKKEKSYQALVNKYIPKVATLAKRTADLEGSKVKIMYDIGTSINKLCIDLSNKQIAGVKKRFSAATNISENFVSGCSRFANRYDEKDLKKILDARLSTQFVRAITTVESKEDGDKVLKLALSGSVTPEDIRKEIATMKKSKVEAGSSERGPGSGKSLKNTLKKSLAAVSVLTETSEDYYSMEKFYDPEKDEEMVKKTLESISSASKVVKDLEARLRKLVK